MGRGRRVLRILKWAGVAWCLILVVAWPASANRTMAYIGSVCGLGFEQGAVIIFAGAQVRDGVLWDTFKAPYWFGFYRSGFMPTLVAAPIWLALLLSIPTTALLFYIDRRKRIPPGHCQSCGYDLTGNVSGVCSECGTEVVESGRG